MVVPVLENPGTYDDGTFAVEAVEAAAHFACLEEVEVAHFLLAHVMVGAARSGVVAYRPSYSTLPPLVEA